MSHFAARVPRLLLGVLLLVGFVVAQQNSRQVLIEQFESKRATNPEAAYLIAKEFLRQFDAEPSEARDIIRSWVRAYEKISGEPQENGNSISETEAELSDAKKLARLNASINERRDLNAALEWWNVEGRRNSTSAVIPLLYVLRANNSTPMVLDPSIGFVVSGKCSPNLLNVKHSLEVIGSEVKRGRETIYRIVTGETLLDSSIDGGIVQLLLTDRQITIEGKRKTITPLPSMTEGRILSKNYISGRTSDGKRVVFRLNNSVAQPLPLRDNEPVVSVVDTQYGPSWITPHQFVIAFAEQARSSPFQLEDLLAIGKTSDPSKLLLLTKRALIGVAVGSNETAFTNILVGDFSALTSGDAGLSVCMSSGDRLELEKSSLFISGAEDRNQYGKLLLQKAQDMIRLQSYDRAAIHIIRSWELLDSQRTETLISTIIDKLKSR